MDWGGVIAGAVGGLSNSVGSIADDQIKTNARAKEMEMQEQRTIAGEQRRALLQREQFEFEADRKLKGELAARKAYADDYDKVEKLATTKATERDVKALQLPEGQAGPQVTAEVVDTFSPQQRAGYEKQGLIKSRVGSSAIADQIDAAREVGADPKLREDLKNDYKTAAAGESSAAKAARDERKQDWVEERGAAQLVLEGKRADAAINASLAALKRAEKSGDRAATEDAKTNLNTTISTNMKLIEESEKKLMIMNKDDPARKSLEDRVSRAYALVDDAQKGLGGRISGEIDKRAGGDKDKPAADKPAKLPPIEQSGAPKGSTYGSFVAGRGTEIKQNGKVIGYWGAK